MQLRPLLTRLVGFALLPSLLIACGGPAAPKIDTVTSLSGERQLLLGAAVSGAGRDYELLLLAPGDPAPRAWQLQEGRGLSDDGSSCQSIEDAQVWNAEARTLTMSGCFGDQDGLNVIGFDGAVRNLARDESLSEADPVTGSFSKPILRDGAVKLPGGVEYPQYFRHANHREAFAFAGSVYGSEPSENRTYVYVVDEQNGVTAYGEEWAFSEIAHLRWAPDDSAIGFIGSTRTDEDFFQRAYRLDLQSGAVEELSDTNLLIDSTVEFTAGGAVVFAGADEGAAPAIYLAAPGGADAAPVVSLATIPENESWRGQFLLAPDGSRVAFEARRDNLTTPWTLYSADLGSGAIRDLLPVDLQVERTGTVDGADSPFVDVLAWDPDGQAIVFASSLAGHCDNFNAGGVVNCTQQIYSVAADGSAPEPMSETHLTTVGFGIWVE